MSLTKCVDCIYNKSGKCTFYPAVLVVQHRQGAGSAAYMQPIESMVSWQQPPIVEQCGQGTKRYVSKGMTYGDPNGAGHNMPDDLDGYDPLEGNRG